MKTLANIVKLKQIYIYYLAELGTLRVNFRPYWFQVSSESFQKHMKPYHVYSLIYPFFPMKEGIQFMQFEELGTSTL